eukprot:gene4801-9574_t
MYQGLDKGGGGLVGAPGHDNSMDVADSFDCTSADEALICAVPDVDGNPQKKAFSAGLNPINGSITWESNIEVHQIMEKTIGMSQMTSMLHDDDRNRIYEEAISKCIAFFIENSGHAPTVLDVGAGTGLLSLFAAKHGANKVIACEMFEEMSHIAVSVIQTNNMEDMIDMIPNKSTDIQVEDPFADILVSELLDSALLGEGVLFTHSDALSRMIHPSYSSPIPNIDISNRIIPSNAKIFAQLIESNIINSMQNIHTLNYGGISTYRDENASSCEGGHRLIPIHWETIESNGARLLSSHIELLNFEFYHIKDDFSEAFMNEITVTSDGIIHGIMLWWNLYLLSPEIDPNRSCMYSTRPGAQNWQDHWLQVAYPLPHPISCKSGDIISVSAAHNGLQIWLEAHLLVNQTPSTSTSIIPMDTVLSNIDNNLLQQQQLQSDPLSKKFKTTAAESPTTAVEEVTVAVKDPSSLPPPSRREVWEEEKVCECGWHALLSAERFEALNDIKFTSIWHSAMKKIIHKIMMMEMETEKMSCRAFTMSKIIQDNLSKYEINHTEENNEENETNNNNNDNDNDNATTEMMISKSNNMNLNNMKVVSLEEKQFSRILHEQILYANNLEEVMLIWDGEDWNEINSYFSSENNDNNDHDNDKDCEEKEDQNQIENNNNNEEMKYNTTTTDYQSSLPMDDDSLPVLPTTSVSTVKIAALVSDCFYFQLHAQPTWQALRFLYTRRSYEDRLLKNAIICPCRGRVMAMALELQDLIVSHGDANSVHGFDHTSFDSAKGRWHDHHFPYKIGTFRHRILSDSYCIALLDYTSGMIKSPQDDSDTNNNNNNSNSNSNSNNETSFQSNLLLNIDMIMRTTGRCDCVVIWVDYDLIENDNEDIIRYFSVEKQNFPYHLKTFIKFLPHSLPVVSSQLLKCTASINDGDSDFTLSFNLNV